MSNKVLDIDLRPLKGKRGKVDGGSRRSIIGDRDTVARTVRGCPEVMIKNVSSASDRANVQLLVNYISQDQTQPVEDENGNVFTGAHTVSDALYDWHEVPQQSTGRREVMHLMLSMPAAKNPEHTPHEQVLIAARQFARTELSNHKYLIAQHHDTGHAHVHMLVNMAPIRGNKRLNPWKPDFQRWRETFAHNLRGLGVEANATPRAARGVTMRPKNQAVFQIDQRHNTAGSALSVRSTQAAQDARTAATGITPAGISESEAQARTERITASKQTAEETRARVLDEYAAMAAELSAGNADDQKFAREIQRFVRELPPVMTRHDVRVMGIQAHDEQRNTHAHKPFKGRALKP